MAVKVIEQNAETGNDLKVIRRAQIPVEQMKKKRVAAYCRVSKDIEEQETSIRIQMESYNQIIREHPDWELAGIYADKGKTGKFITVCFIAILLSVFLYNILQMKYYSNMHVNWVAGRFTGVRDPNNFALQCNICFVLVYGYLKDNINKWLYNIVVAILLIGTFSTLSVSGIGTCLFVLGIILYKQGKSKPVYYLVFLLSIILLVSVALGNIDVSGIPVLSSAVERFSGIVNSLETGNYYAATTSRSAIWDAYLNNYNSFSGAGKMLGDPSAAVAFEQQFGIASHNGYIDFLTNYGQIGLGLVVIALLTTLFNNLKNKNTVFWLLNMIMIVNLFFRTMNGVLVWFCLFI